MLLYFNAHAGQLTSVLVADDVAYPTGAGGAAPRAHRLDGGRLVVEGQFTAVLDGEGRGIAPGGAHTVVLDRTGAVVDAN